jgi:hypothetical protein
MYSKHMFTQELLWSAFLREQKTTPSPHDAGPCAKLAGAAVSNFTASETSLKWQGPFIRCENRTRDIVQIQARVPNA